jgi:uncharacterized protein (TIGR00255 family)
MTGYGRNGGGGEGDRFSIEVRSLNNRYLDVQVKIPRGLAMLEPRVKKSVQERFSRGRFDVFIARDNGQERNVKPVLDEALAGQYIGLLRELKERFGLSGDVDLALVAGLQDLITVSEAKDDPEALWSVLTKGLSQALDELDRMRAEEGDALVRDIAGRLGTMDTLIQAIHAQAPATVENARKRMEETLARLLHEQPDPVRLAQEIAILAERTDVTEELTRLGSHMTQFRSLLADPGREAVGRKLDFLIQEIGREVNTIASKAMDARISQDAVSLKAELEKIREQVQNIE